MDYRCNYSHYEKHGTLASYKAPTAIDVLRKEIPEAAVKTAPQGL